MIMNRTISGVRSVEKTLLWLDQGILGALYRGALGFAVIPTLRLLTGKDGAEWILIPFLFLVLFALRLASAIARKLLPFSAELREAWSVRRRTAKYYDSYQWRKLTWIGTGLGMYVLISGQYRPVSIALSILCLIVGLAATWKWRALAMGSQYFKPVARKLTIATT